jgi:hypothetical protein
VTEQESASESTAVANTVLLVVNCILLAATAVITSWLRVRFIEFFAEMGVILPLATRLVLCTPPAVYVACFAVAICLVIAKEFVLSARASWSINLLLPAAVTLFLMVYVMSLYLPLSDLIMGMSD